MQFVTPFKACFVSIGIVVFAVGYGFCQDGAGDPALGAKVFRKCKACHAVGLGAVSKVGPILNGVVGRNVASVQDFKYSAAFAKAGASGLVWNSKELDTYLRKPKEYIPGTVMNFVGLRRAKERANVIAYLNSFNANGDKAE